MPASCFDVTDHGAAGDGEILDTVAVQAAIDAAAAARGGTVHVPAGTFLIGTIELKSGVTLDLHPAAKLLERGPAESGIYADFERAGSAWKLIGLDENGKKARAFGADVGLVAATRRYEGPPVWVVTGATGAAVRAAAEALDTADLRDHYAVASEAGAVTPLPLRSGS